MKITYLGLGSLVLVGLVCGLRAAYCVTLHDDAAVRRAMNDELKRTMTELAIPNESRPYFAAVQIEDSNAVRLSAEAGSLLLDQADTSRRFGVSLRVGSSKLDNSYAGMVGFGGRRMQEGPIEDSYLAIRRELWRMSDEAYKHALEALNRKKAMLAARPPKPEADIPDFTQESAHESLSPPPQLDIEKQRELLRERVAHLSTLLSQSGTFVGSSVLASIEVERNRLLNSDGTFTDESHSYVSLTANAKAQADDGMLLQLRQTFTARDADTLPTLDELNKGVRSLAFHLSALRSAKLPEAGPAVVLFEGEAAKQLIVTLIGNSLSGAPAPKFGEGDRDTSLASKLGTDVLSPLISLYDDPTVDSGPGQVPLWGHYAVDSEGTPAQRVSLVENGVLKSLLMSRAPRKEIGRSNGHARDGGPGIGNLFVKAKSTLSRERLIERATRESRTAKKPMAIYVVRRLSARPASEFDSQVMGSANPTLELFESDDTVYAEDASLLGGKEMVPVRGLILEGLTLRSLKDIIAAGNTSDAQNFESGDGHVSVIAPSLLLSRVDTRPATGELPRLPAYTPPK